MIIKTFDEWNTLKKEIDKSQQSPFCHTREIWFAKLGENIGFEQSGRGKEFLRPIVVLKKFNSHVFWAIPLTTKEKKGKYYFYVENSGGKKAWAILSQIRLMDTRRLKYKIGDISGKVFEGMKKAINEILLSEDDF